MQFYLLLRLYLSSHSRLLIGFHIHLAAAIGHGASVIKRRLVIVLTIWIRSRCPGSLVLMVMVMGRLILLMVRVVVRSRRTVGISVAAAVAVVI